MKKAAVIFSVVLAFSVSAADWIPIASTDTHTWEGRAGTRTEGQTRNGAAVMKAAGRIFNKPTKAYTFVQWYVTLSDCKAGQGKLVTLDMNGDVRYDNEFVFKGGSVASELAEMLCAPIVEANGRGI